MHIPIEQRVTAITLSLIFFLATVHLIRKHKLREEYALIWLAANLSIVLLSIFGGLVTLLANLFSVTYAPTLILVLGLLFALVVLFSHSVVVSSQARCIRDLAQNIALLEWRLRQLEKDAPPVGIADGKPGEISEPATDQAVSAAMTGASQINDL